jgi:hypothetical protein
LQTNYVGSFKGSNFNHLFCSFENGPFLLLYWFTCWQHDLWLNGSHFNTPLSSQLFIKWSNSESFYFNLFLLCLLFCWVFQWNLFRFITIKDLSYTFENSCWQVFLQWFVAIDQLGTIVIFWGVFSLFLYFW